MGALLGAGWGFALLLFRCAALLLALPGIGSPLVSTRVRMGVILAIAFAAYVGAGSPAPPMPGSLLQLAAGGMRETLVGVCAGLAVRLVLEAASSAGQLASTGMGLGYGAQLDPVMGAESTALAQLFSTVALCTAVAIGLHREAILWLVRSLRAAPLGSGAPFRELMQQLVSTACFAGAFALRLGLPLLGAMTLGHIVLGLVGRTTPQLNLQSMGFSVAIVAGGLALWLFAPDAAMVAARTACSLLQR